MKVLTLASLIFLSIPAFSSTNYSCIAGKSETINFLAKVDNSQITVSFQKASSQDTADDLNKKTVNLALDKSRNQGWKNFVGKTQVDKRFSDYRHFAINLSPQTPVGGSTLIGSFEMSPRSLEQWPSSMYQYDLKCQLVK